MNNDPAPVSTSTSPLKRAFVASEDNLNNNNNSNVPSSPEKSNPSKPKEMKLGGGEACCRCTKIVYFAEKAVGPGLKVYHKMCFKCIECNKQVDSSIAADKDGELFCRSCHSKRFGPKGYGFGGGGAFLNNDPSPQPMGTGTSPTKQALENNSTTKSPTKNTGSYGGSSETCNRCGKSVYFGKFFCSRIK